MFHMKFGNFYKKFLSFENGIKILICNFERIFVKLKSHLLVIMNFEKIFKIIKIDFYIL